MACPSTSIDPNWYLDSSATDHITDELEKLTMHERYNGNDKIRAANSAGMDINHIGKSIIPTSSCLLHLNHISMFLMPANSLFPSIILPLIIIHLSSYIRIFS
jgi:hypothetical protein